MKDVRISDSLEYFIRLSREDAHFIMSEKADIAEALYGLDIVDKESVGNRYLKSVKDVIFSYMMLLEYIEESI